MTENFFNIHFDLLKYSDIKSLIENSVPESEILEYKSSFPNRIQLTKILTGFANVFGGYLMIGIEDIYDIESNRYLLHEKGINKNNYEFKIKEILKNSIKPEIHFKIKEFEVPSNPDNVLLVIKVDRSEIPISSIDEDKRYIAKSYYRLRNYFVHSSDPTFFYHFRTLTEEQKLLSLIKKGEDEVLEFKSTYKWDINKNQVNKELMHEISIALCAFLNSEGGTLLIGVKDNGKIYGLEKDIKLFKTLDKLQQDITNTIRSDLGGSGMDFKMSTKKINSKIICIIEIDSSNNPVFYKNKEFYIRRGSASHNLNPKETYYYIKKHFFDSSYLSSQRFH